MATLVCSAGARNTLGPKYNARRVFVVEIDGFDREAGGCSVNKVEVEQLVRLRKTKVNSKTNKLLYFFIYR